MNSFKVLEQIIVETSSEIKDEKQKGLENIKQTLHDSGRMEKLIKQARTEIIINAKSYTVIRNNYGIKVEDVEATKQKKDELLINAEREIHSESKKTIQKVENDIEQLSESIKGYDRDIITITQDFENRGFKLIGVLPKLIFNDLCRKYKLFRFEHITQDGITYSEIKSTSRSLHHMFPDFVDCSYDPNATQCKITIATPDNPKDSENVSNIIDLINKHNYKIGFAVDEKAVTLHESIISEPIEKDDDPILYCFNKNYAFILYQYGNFKSEIDLIATIKEIVKDVAMRNDIFISPKNDTVAEGIVPLRYLIYYIVSLPILFYFYYSLY